MVLNDGYRRPRGDSDGDIEAALGSAIAAVGDGAQSIFRSLFSALAPDQEKQPDPKRDLEPEPFEPFAGDERTVETETSPYVAALPEHTPSLPPPPLLVSLKALCTQILREHLDSLVPPALGEQIANLVQELISDGLNGTSVILVYSVLLIARRRLQSHFLLESNS